MTSVGAASQRYWAVVPAAGAGTRMAAEKPKQYLPLKGKTIIQHTLERLLSHRLISGLCVAVAPNDQYWDAIELASDKTIISTEGGKERCYSVINALEALSRVAEPDDWVLVHDAARPCVRPQDIDKLIEELCAHPVGGILAVPVHDTIKRSGIGAVIEATVDRRHLWHAQTPQMFRLNILKEALKKAIQDDFIVTDEASAIEHAGLRPNLVEGHADNIKITRPEDLPLAEFYLQGLFEAVEKIK